MEKRSFNLIQRTAATLAALVFALVAGVCALSESKKVNASELPNGVYVADSYIATFNGSNLFYNVYFCYDTAYFNFAFTSFSFAGDYLSLNSGDVSFDTAFSCEYWGGSDDDNLIIVSSSSNNYDFSLTSSVSRTFDYDVPLSSSASAYLDDPSFDELSYTLIIYTFSDGVNSHDIEVYIPYSDITRETIEAQQSNENAIEENENLKRQGAIMIVVIISMIIGFCVLLFTRSR